MKKDHILNELIRTAKANNNVALGRNRFLEETGIREVDWKGIYWINWSDAVKEAGLTPNAFQQAFDTEELLSLAAQFIRELGHFPQRAELNLKRKTDPLFPSEKTFRKFGKKAFFAKAVYEWCQKNEGWEDVSALCKELKAQAIESPVEPEDESLEESGYVYLMKSGKHYKIGRTNSIDRRQYELGMQLPEGIEPIHSIATDDPSGIEAYWHNRFREKHMNGEWFNLSRKDIAIFKKRKSM